MTADGYYYGITGFADFLYFLAITHLGMGYTQLLIFSVFYGLDWIAIVPPTAKLTSDAFGKEKAGMIFGWIVVAHQAGASLAAYGSGMLRDWLGNYTVPFVLAGFLCLFAAVMSLRIRGMRKTAALSFN